MIPVVVLVLVLLMSVIACMPVPCHISNVEVAGIAIGAMQRLHPLFCLLESTPLINS